MKKSLINGILAVTKILSACVIRYKIFTSRNENELKLLPVSTLRRKLQSLIEDLPIWMLEKAFKDDVFNTVDLLTIVHDVVSSCGMKNSLIAKRILGAIVHLEMVEADESNLIEACAMAENEARAGSEKSADTVILAALNNSVNEQETSAGEIQVSEKSDGITLLDPIADPTGVEVRHVIDTEENSIVDLTQSVGSNYNIASSDNAHVLEQRDTLPSPLADPSVSDEDIVADVTKNNTDHASTASDLPSEDLEDSQAGVPISSRKRSIVSEDEMLETQFVSGKRARIEEAIDSAKNDDTTINSDISDGNNGEQNCHLLSETVNILHVDLPESQPYIHVSPTLIIVDHEFGDR
ncbi:hypothetical protein QAD02_021742 [Eretmocerus hayati]|uniref:Uncharacterized protein n=1 Tax=Eretmocerus hayati TaxID=131215 RepID=A0ACC2PRK5_9HYME|nr:hypothetical protein QAD02_021742 [Eretmocerus hayati]